MKAVAAGTTALGTTSPQRCVATDALQTDADARYILLRMAGNDKFLAPREAGVVYAAVRSRFRSDGSAPLSRIAWRVVPQRNGWVQLQHVLTKRWMRLVPPPSDVQWVVRAELDPTPFGKQTWFRLEGPSGEPIDVTSVTSPSSPRSVHLRCHVTGAYLNYRGRPVPTEEDFVRGHGNQMQRNQWVAVRRRSACANFSAEARCVKARARACNPTCPRPPTRLRLRLRLHQFATPLAIIRPCHDVQCRAAPLPPLSFSPAPPPLVVPRRRPRGWQARDCSWRVSRRRRSLATVRSGRECAVRVPRPVLQRLGGGGRGARRGGVGWREVCWKHYAESTCNALIEAHGPRIGEVSSSSSSASLSLSAAAAAMGAKARCSCERARAPGVPRHTPALTSIQTPTPSSCTLLHPLAPAPSSCTSSSCTLLRPHPLAPPPPTGRRRGGPFAQGEMGASRLRKVRRTAEAVATPLADDAGGGAADAAHGSRGLDLLDLLGGRGGRGGRRQGALRAAGAGVLLLLVSDRPNQFLCHYFESAALHGLSPTVLGWDDSGWASGERKPWTYYLGGKLVLLEYLERCAYPDDALVLFTDHDVVFQGGYDAMRAAYERAVAASNGAPLIFSAEKESYPRELQGLYPSAPLDLSRGPADYLNSGMWMGPVGGAKVRDKAPPLPLSLCLLRRLSSSLSASPPPLLRLSSASPPPLLSPSPPLPFAPLTLAYTSPVAPSVWSLLPPSPSPPSPSLPLPLPPSRSRSCA